MTVRAGGSPLSTPAFVVRIVDYSESDRVVTLLTRAVGKVAALARGARRSRRRFGAALAPFILGEADLRERRAELYGFERFEAIRDLSAVTFDVAKMAHAGYLTELVREMSPERQPEPRLFDLYLEALGLLCEGPARPELLRAFEVRLLAVLGLRPALDRCATCGAARVEDQFDPGRGGCLCSACSPGALTLSEPARRALLAAAEMSLAEAASRSLHADANAQARGAMIACIEHHLGRRLRSPAFIAELGRK